MKKLDEELKKMKILMHLLESGFGSLEEQIINFLHKNKIEFTKVSYLGKGEYGIAYSLGNDTVLKITSSENEFHIGTQLVGKKLPSIVKYYSYGWFGDNKPQKYYLVMDELDTDSSIDDNLSRVEMILTTQDLGLSYEGLTYFDYDEYDNSEGNLDPEIINFMKELRRIYISCQQIGIVVPDVNYGNLGYDKSGVLTLFDVQDRKAMGNNKNNFSSVR